MMMIRGSGRARKEGGRERKNKTPGESKRGVQLRWEDAGESRQELSRPSPSIPTLTLLPSLLPSPPLPPYHQSTGFLGKYLQFELGKVGYRLYLANRGDEQDVRPFKVAFDLGQVWMEGGEGGEGGRARGRKRDGW